MKMMRLEKLIKLTLKCKLLESYWYYMVIVLIEIMYMKLRI